MVFSSILFLFYFLPMVLGLYYLAHRFFPNRHIKHAVLTFLSYLFYGWTNPLFVLLMFSSTLIDYLCGLWMTGHFSKGARATWQQPTQSLSPKRSKLLHEKLALTLSICSNLSLLGFFKYFNFGMDSWNAVMQAAGLHQATYENFLRITLPLGISFYTFQSMSYSIDVYRGDAKAIRNWSDFACYVSMFPQLVAGPIIRFQELADQIEQRTHTREKIARGITFIGMGLAKKVLLADPCGKVADQCFEAGSIGIIDAWSGAFAYSFQIYFDFSAYSDMAIGLGLLFGFMFAKNFDSPYRADSITDFWRRWHLSLSTWLRDYLYIPLGGNRKGPSRTYINLMLVMLLGGLWHGASWNFVIWGGIHGGMLALERLHGKKGFMALLPPAMRIVFTFIIVTIAWVFFRAPDLSTSWHYLCSMFGMVTVTETAHLIPARIYTLYHVTSILLAVATVWFGRQTWDYTREITWPKVAAIGALSIAAIIMLMASSYHPFIYFIF